MNPAELISRPPRARVIVDNDFAGDPDDLFQLAHHLLSPSVEIPFVIASRLPAVPPRAHLGSVDRGVSEVAALLEQMKIDIPVLRGTEQDRSDAAPVRSEASDAIVVEAMRDDTDLPLYVVLGGGLTELANAYLAEPAIAERLTAVWIGGAGYSDPEPAEPSMFGAEYNMNIDVASAQVVFGSPIPLWQVPADAYRRCLVSWAELRRRVGSLGGLGAHLLSALDGFADRVGEHGLNVGETYVLGDSPLVLLTALQSGFDPDPASSDSVMMPRMSITDSGWYGAAQPTLPPVRVFTRPDTRLMFEDMFAKFALHAADAGAR
ncbi:nucleoside hydrolase [Leifsonia sp. L25]|uniref:nucleoside hydrolase n=1 Tax=Actinomycetes TaxID=1760 RepID=UPI003D695A55